MQCRQWAYDLHIHSCLSPCGHRDMTPNNIINMSLIKGLDLISVTDHNTAKNLPAVFEAAKDKELLIVPGIEVNTKEEVHILCYFPTLEAVMRFDHYIEPYLPQIKNNRALFGEQLILNKKDEVVGEYDFLLINALLLSMEEIHKMVVEMGGIMVPAHIDRNSYSIISNLGFIPSNLAIRTIELSMRLNEKEKNIWKQNYKGFNIIQSSDAHSLEQILERSSYLKLEKLDIDLLFHFLIQ